MVQCGWFDERGEEDADEAKTRSVNESFILPLVLRMTGVWKF